MIKKTLGLCLWGAVSLSAAMASLKWESLNPGSGGRIMDVVLDKNTPGRAYYCSDMEGLSRTDDHGKTWQHISKNMSFCNILTVKVENGNPNRIYSGTLGTFEISDDGGKNWTVHPDVELPIGRIIIHPQNNDHVILAPSNHMRWINRPNLAGPLGQPGVYVSNDRGKSFKFVAFRHPEGRRDVYDLTTHPTDSKVWFAAAETGLFKSMDGGASWEKAKAPKDTRGAWGSSITPDGQYLYAIFQIMQSDKERSLGLEKQGTQLATKLYVQDLKSGEWTDLSTPGTGYQQKGEANWSNKNRVYWRPEIDPRSNDSQHRLLTASLSERSGLYEITVDFKNGKPSKTNWKKVFYYDNDGKGVDYDTGWERYSTRPLAWDYVPLEWKDDAKVWTTGDQTVYRSAKELDLQDWQQLYCDYIQTIEGKRFYRTRGVQCTFVFDSHGRDNYVIQNNADNAIKESYDFGKSWHVGVKMPRSNAVEIVDSVQPPIVLSHISSGYGADSDKGLLYAKRLEHYSPKDKWKVIGGSPKELGKLPFHTLYEQIVQDPHKKGRVFVGTYRKGVYLIDDIEKFYEGKSKAKRISAIRGQGPRRVNDKTQGLVVHPYQKGTIYVAENGNIWEGKEAKKGKWNWTLLKEGTDSELTVWGHQKKLYMMTNGIKDGKLFMEISKDGGKSWSEALNFDNDIKPLANHSWFKNFKLPMRARGLLGYQDKIFVSFYQWESGKSYGTFCGTLKGNSIEWKDITGNHIYPCPVKCRIVETKGSKWLQMSTKGAGLWRANIDSLVK